MKVVSLPFKVEESEVLRYLGYREGITAPWSQPLPLREVESMVTVKGMYATYQLDSADQSISLLAQSRDISRLLQNASRVSFLAVTLGSQLDAAIEQSFSLGAYTKAAILDAIGSAAAEAAMESLYQLVAREAGLQGYALTPRFSPGYGDFPLDYQQTLCTRLNTSTIGLQVTSYSVLLPRKSVTALAGWQRGPHCPVSASTNCTGCALLQCKFRRQEKEGDGSHE